MQHIPPFLLPALKYSRTFIMLCKIRLERVLCAVFTRFLVVMVIYDISLYEVRGFQRI